MKPYYSQDGITIYHGDSAAVLPLLDGWDCVVTSPPYNTLPTKHTPSGIHAERKTGINKWIKAAVDGYSDAMPEEEYQKWLLNILDLCYAKCRGLMWVNHKIRYRDGIAIHPARMFPWPIYSEVIWDRRVSMALNCKRYAPSTEHLLGFGIPYYWDDQLNSLLSVWRIGFDNDPNGHPCSFPIALAERPIISSTREGDTVLDPFMGSGTTLVAARDLGRRAIGIEIEEKYCAMAEKRLETTPLPLGYSESRKKEIK